MVDQNSEDLTSVASIFSHSMIPDFFNSDSVFNAFLKSAALLWAYLFKGL